MNIKDQIFWAKMQSILYKIERSAKKNIWPQTDLKLLTEFSEILQESKKKIEETNLSQEKKIERFQAIDSMTILIKILSKKLEEKTNDEEYRNTMRLLFEATKEESTQFIKKTQK